MCCSSSLNEVSLSEGLERKVWLAVESHVDFWVFIALFLARIYAETGVGSYPQQLTIDSQ